MKKKIVSKIDKKFEQKKLTKKQQKKIKGGDDAIIVDSVDL